MENEENKNENMLSNVYILGYYSHRTMKKMYIFLYFDDSVNKDFLLVFHWMFNLKYKIDVGKAFYVK